MDSLLLPYLQATDESERHRQLDELLLVYAGPVIRHTLWRKLAFNVNQFGVSPQNEDAEDLYQEIVVKTIELLHGLPTAEPTDIQNFRQYVSRIATNTCHDYIRARSPERSRLKYKLRDLMSRRKEFASWQSGDKLLCGLAIWRGREPLPSRRIAEIGEELHIFESTQYERAELGHSLSVKLVADLLEWAGGPIELKALVQLMATLLDVKDHPSESLDDEEKGYLETEISDTTLMTNTRADFEKFLGSLWLAARALREKQRLTFCFGFEYEKGEDLFTLLLDADIVTLSQLAQEFGRSSGELVRLWQKMPMNNASIAEELGATPQQVRQWRFHAEENLEKRHLPFRENSSPHNRNSKGKLPSYISRGRK
jgi:RNA polymerase sigma factor (sigma-70 family)